VKWSDQRGWGVYGKNANKKERLTTHKVSSCTLPFQACTQRCPEPWFTPRDQLSSGARTVTVPRDIWRCWRIRRAYEFAQEAVGLADLLPVTPERLPRPLGAPSLQERCSSHNTCSRRRRDQIETCKEPRNLEERPIFREVGDRHPLLTGMLMTVAPFRTCSDGASAFIALVKLSQPSRQPATMPFLCRASLSRVCVFSKRRIAESPSLGLKRAILIKKDV
jgi:hypothetical protein